MRSWLQAGISQWQHTSAIFAENCYWCNAWRLPNHTIGLKFGGNIGFLRKPLEWHLTISLPIWLVLLLIHNPVWPPLDSVKSQHCRNVTIMNVVARSLMLWLCDINVAAALGSLQKSWKLWQHWCYKASWQITNFQRRGSANLNFNDHRLLHWNFKTQGWMLVTPSHNYVIVISRTDSIQLVIWLVLNWLKITISVNWKYQKWIELSMLLNGLKLNLNCPALFGRTVQPANQTSVMTWLF